MFCTTPNPPTDASPVSHSRCPGGFFLFYLCFPLSFAAARLSTWVFLQLLSPFTVVNLHHAIPLGEEHQILQLFNLFYLGGQRGKAAGKVPSRGQRARWECGQVSHPTLSILLEGPWASSHAPRQAWMGRDIF